MSAASVPLELYEGATRCLRMFNPSLERTLPGDTPPLAPPAETGRTDHPLALPQGWQVCDLSDAIAGTGQKPPWVIEDLLLAKSATQVSAHPHSVKSFSWLGACLESVAVHKVWGHFDASSVKSSLFIESEDPRSVLEQRVRGIAKGLGLKSAKDAPGFHYLRTGPFDLVSMETTLAQILDHYKPDFVVLSTLQSLLKRRYWKEQQDMQPVNSLIVRLADRYCPIVLITQLPGTDARRELLEPSPKLQTFLPLCISRR